MISLLGSRFIYFIKKNMWNVTFADLNLSKKLLEGIEKKWYKKPSLIQEKVIPLLLESDKDIIWQAQTGTGKTAAFSIPMIEKIDPNSKDVKWLILCPTRELAKQVAEEFSSFLPWNEFKVTLLYGGKSISQEIKELKDHPTIVVGAPGRVKDHLLKWRLKLDNLEYFVLDEADEMLNIWFRQDIEDIFSYTPKDKKVLLFSATMPKAIIDIAKKYMREYNIVSVKKKDFVNPNINQRYYEVTEWIKKDVLTRIIETEDDFYSIVFCRTKMDVDEVASYLNLKWYKAEGIHGDIEQKMREKVLKRFKEKKINILVATDVAARWIDINDITHVINYTIPENVETYTHRIWRTARAWKKWVAISFVTRKDIRRIKDFEKITKSKIEKAKLPSVDEVIKKKKAHLIDSIKEIIEGEWFKDYLDIAEELLELNSDDKVIISSLIKRFYDNELNKNFYKIVKIPRRIETNSKNSDNWNYDNNGMIRLFIAKWRTDNIDNPWKILNFLRKETSLDMKNAWKISIYDKFSYVDFPKNEWEEIINIFKQKNPEKPEVVKAKPRR